MIIAIITFLLFTWSLIELDKHNEIITDIKNKSLKERNEQQNEINNLHKELTLKSQLLDQEKELAAKKYEEWVRTESQKIRESTVKTTRSVLHGKSVEHLAPILLQPYDQRDIKWLGDPVDYLIFHNANKVRDGEAEEIEIILTDIKTGSASLNKVQRKIKEAIIAGRVSFITFNPDEDKIIKWECQQTKRNGTAIPNQQNPIK